jgi:hypothetical protein
LSDRVPCPSSPIPIAIIAAIGIFVAASSVSAAPPVTSPEAPSPAPALAARWVKAVFQSQWIELADPRVARSEELRMLLAVQNGEKLGPGVGWFGPASRRYEWKWFAERYDANRDGRVTRDEFGDASEFFERLDRDGSGAVTAADFDWSERSPWVKRDAMALRLFREIDRDGDGHVTDKEWQAYMKRKAAGKDFLTPADMRAILEGPRQQSSAGKAEKRVSKNIWLRSLFAGDLGSAFEGPRANKMAPDFTLPKENGKGTVTLSDFRGQKPVVLVFGSFT